MTLRMPEVLSSECVFKSEILYREYYMYVCYVPASEKIISERIWLLYDALFNEGSEAEDGEDDGDEDDEDDDVRPALPRSLPFVPAVNRGN